MTKIMTKLLIDEFQLDVINLSNDKNLEIVESDINRPGLPLAGFRECYADQRIHIIGNVEWSYLKTLDSETQIDRLEWIFKHKIPAVIISNGLPSIKSLEEMAKKYNRNLFRTNMKSSLFIKKLVTFQNEVLAPETQLHGVLVDIFGIGTLIQGKSGVGKSETALELIKRGHRLVADDAVIVKLIEDNTIVGRSPENIKHFMEIRGIGILDIKHLYGFGSIRNSKKIGLVINLENWDDKKTYDRVGIDNTYSDILGANVPSMTIPVKPGRNLAIVLEAAAKQQRQKCMGYNAAEELDRRIKTMKC